MSYFDHFIPTFKPVRASLQQDLEHNQPSSAYSRKHPQRKGNWRMSTYPVTSQPAAPASRPLSESRPEPTPPDSGRSENEGVRERDTKVLHKHEGFERRASRALPPASPPSSSEAVRASSLSSSSHGLSGDEVTRCRGQQHSPTWVPVGQRRCPSAGRCLGASPKADARRCDRNDRLTRRESGEGEGDEGEETIADFTVTDQRQRCHGYDDDNYEDADRDGATKQRSIAASSHAGGEAQRRQRALEWEDSDSEGDRRDRGNENEDRLTSTHRRTTSSSRNASRRPILLWGHDREYTLSTSVSPHSRPSHSPRHQLDGIVYDRIPIRDTPHNPFLGDADAANGWRTSDAGRRRANPAQSRGEDAERAYRKGMITYVFRGQRIVYADAPLDLEDEEDLLQPDGSMRPRYRFQPKLLFPEAHEREQRKRRQRLQQANYAETRDQAQAQQRACAEDIRVRPQMTAFARNQSMYQVTSILRDENTSTTSRVSESSSHKQYLPSIVRRGMIFEVDPTSRMHGQKRAQLHDESSADEGSEKDPDRHVHNLVWQGSRQWPGTIQHRPIISSASSTSSIFKMARRERVHDHLSHRNRQRLSEFHRHSAERNHAGDSKRQHAGQHQRLLAQLDRAGWQSDGSSDSDEEPVSRCRSSQRDSEYAGHDEEPSHDTDHRSTNHHEGLALAQDPSLAASFVSTVSTATKHRPSLAHRAATSVVVPSRAATSQLSEFPAPAQRPSSSASQGVHPKPSENPFDLNFFTSDRYRR